MKANPSNTPPKEADAKGAARPADGPAAEASPDALDAPEYYSKDRKPEVGTPDAAPGSSKAG